MEEDLLLDGGEDVCDRRVVAHIEMHIKGEDVFNQMLSYRVLEQDWIDRNDRLAQN